MSLHGAPGNLRPASKEANKPAPGFCRVVFLAHYGPYMTNDRAALTWSEVDAELQKDVREQRFKVIAEGPRRKDRSRKGDGVGRRNAKLD